jgi:hypothetical protein
LTQEDLKAAERERLQDPAHLDLFLDWYQLGGLEKGIGLSELATMPAALRADLLYLLRELGRMRRQRKARKKGRP